MIKETLWQPDTCDCRITYSWDTDSPEDNRPFTVVNVEPCEHHNKEELPTIEDKFTAVNLENKTKNITIGEIVKRFPDIKHQDVEWSFDENRNLVIDTSKLDQSKTSEIEAIVAAIDVG